MLRTAFSTMEGSMKKAIVIALLAACATASDAQTPAARQWQVNDETGSVKASTPYELYNTRRKELNLSSQLGFFKGQVAWVGHTGGHFEFRRANVRDHRTLTPADSVAIYNTKTKRHMLSLESKTAGNLIRWMPEPSHEWQIHDRKGADFALFNTKRRAYYVLGGKDEILTFTTGSSK